MQEGKNYLDIMAFAFAQCKELKSIKLPSNTHYVDSMAFYGCNNLKNIDVPEHLRDKFKNNMQIQG